MKPIIGFVAATVTAAMTMVLPALPAAAQMPGMNLMTEPSALTEEEKQKRAEQEKAYKEQLGKIPNQKANNDPWGKVRSADRPPLTSAPKAKKNQEQTGSK